MSVFASSREENLGIAWADISTGEFYISGTDRSQPLIIESSKSSFLADLVRISPAEILLSETLAAEGGDIVDAIDKMADRGAGMAISKQPDELFNLRNSRRKLDRLMLQQLETGSRNQASRNAEETLRLLSSNKSLERACGGILNYLVFMFTA